MRKQLIAVCCTALLLAGGCAWRQPMEGDPPSAGEHILPESPAGDSATNRPPPIDEAPVLPYEQTVAAITPRLASLALEHRERYPDTVGWLRVPGTAIDNAVVQSDDVTNEYYLQHDLDGNPDSNGTYSAKTGCSLAGGRGEISRNITLFAHNHDENPDGILFAQLKRYKDPEFARANPYLYFSTCDEDMVWEIVAVFDTVKQYQYIHADPSWARQKRVLEMALAASIYDYGIVPGRDDRFLTLSTCSFDIPGVGRLPLTPPNDYRFVVLARLVNPGEEKKNQAAITLRDEFLLPDDFPLYDDYISLGGWAYHLREDEFDNPMVQPLNESALAVQGTVRRTVEAEDPQDWDATQLPVGTQVYVDPMYPRVLVVDYDGERLYYVPDNVRLLLERDGEVLAMRTIDDVAADLLWPENLSEETVIRNREAPPPAPGSLVVVLENRNDRHTYRYPYYLATPPTIGDEVMLMREYDGYFCRDAMVFQELLALFPDDVE